MRKGIVTISALVLILGVAPASFAQRPLTIRLGVHGAVQGTPDVIAIRQGYFKQERLEVDWRRFGVGREGRDAMIAGAISAIGSVVAETSRDGTGTSRAGAARRRWRG